MAGGIGWDPYDAVMTSLVTVVMITAKSQICQRKKHVCAYTGQSQSGDDSCERWCITKGQ